MTILLIAFATNIIVFGGFGFWVAGQRNRDQSEGLILGSVFGPFGVLIEVLLPPGTPPKPSTRRRRVNPTWSDPGEIQVGFTAPPRIVEENDLRGLSEAFAALGLDD